MSMQAPPGYQPPGQGTAGVTEAITQLQNIARQLGNWVSAYRGRQTFGTFTLTAIVSTQVLQPSVQANSIISLMATNAAAGTLMGSAKFLYVSAIAPGASFTLTTSSGVPPAGGEQFSYLVTTPT